MKPEVFSGIKILDFGSFIAGPAGSMMMANLGAEVIKVEHPVRFDGARYFQTGVGHPTPDPVYGTQFFDVSNMGKKSLVLDYSKPEGAEILKKMIETCDVFLENMIPGSLSKYGFGYEEIKKIKPDIVYVSSCSCGQTGPEKFFRGYAGHFAAKSGLARATGYEGYRPPVFTGDVDFRSATNTTIAIILGLIYRQKTGKGQYIDIASQEAIGAQLGDLYLEYILNGEPTKLEGDKRPGYCPNRAFPAKGDDKWISISCYSDEEFNNLAKVINREDLINDPKFSCYDCRKQNEDELEQIISEWTANYDRFEAWKILREGGVPSSPSYDAQDLATDSHNILRESCTTLDHPLLGRDYVVNPPWRWMSETPARIKEHAPILGRHTKEIMLDLGYSKEQIDSLAEKGIVAVRDK